MDQVPAECRDACEGELGGTGGRLSCSTRPGGIRCGRFRTRPPRGGWRSRRPPRPTRCCRCSGPGPACDSARRGHPLAPQALRLGRGLLAAGVRLFAGPGAAPRRARGRVVLRRPERPPARPARRPDPRRHRGRPGGAADRLGGDPVAVVARRLSLRPRPRPVRGQVAARRAALEGRRRRLRPGGCPAAARRQAAEFLAAVAERLRRFAAERGRRGLLVFAIDTELLGHWWSEGATWLGEVLAGAAEAGVRLLTAPQALAEHEPLARPLAASTWGEEKDLSTWDSPAVADLAWGARRSELRLLRALGQGLLAPPRSAPRASCSLSRRATGPSSTGATRRGTIPTGAAPITPRRCSRP